MELIDFGFWYTRMAWYGTACRIRPVVGYDFHVRDRVELAWIVMGCSQRYANICSFELN